MQNHRFIPEWVYTGGAAYASVVSVFSSLACVSLFGLYKMNPNVEFAQAASGFVAWSIAVNGATLLHLSYLFAFRKSHRESTLVRILIVLSNIPIAFYLIHNL
ncbi:MAG: hypothetical protein EOO88_57620 [Pedobacter sp.]|nr:MAG: hypothetical protein EOO88_57620 [Pedobacter sp.]